MEAPEEDAQVGDDEEQSLRPLLVSLQLWTPGPWTETGRQYLESPSFSLVILELTQSVQVQTSF